MEQYSLLQVVRKCKHNFIFDDVHLRIVSKLIDLQT